MMKYIPDSMSYPFTVWMSESGFYPSYKKGYIVMKRGKEVAKISLIETKKGFEMNEVCQKRFTSFCRTWMNKDKHFIDQLRMRGLSGMNQLRYQLVA
ncbi:hypothetical protein [Acinetobacter pittii]|uniref:hypothetical protein n=1 Tax=Acinetobacter pittii TaxID=48296 RepID=UPI001230F3ED|nr:hypothetical protein [Acinetobacter pittii]